MMNKLELILAVILVLSLACGTEEPSSPPPPLVADTPAATATAGMPEGKTFTDVAEDFVNSIGFNSPETDSAFVQMHRLEELGRDTAALVDAMQTYLEREGFGLPGAAGEVLNFPEELAEALRALERNEEHVASAYDRLTGPERQVLEHLRTGYSNMHSVAEMDWLADQFAQSDGEILRSEGKVSAAYADQHQRYAQKFGIQQRAKLRRAKKARDDFKRLNPDLYFADDGGEVYFSHYTEAVYLPLGALSFADEVVTASHPEGMGSTHHLLNAPDYLKLPGGEHHNFYSLGLEGSVVVRFLDNALVDVNGPDLFVFEVGAIEPTRLEISPDGISWVEVGTIEGGVAAVDIGPHTREGELFYFVRLTDLATNSAMPGADIDAIAAIGSALRLQLDSRVLFDTGESTLKPEAAVAIKDLARKLSGLAGGKVIVEGHTDDVGEAGSNRSLSQARAGSVSMALQQQLPDNGLTWSEKGYGESKPLVPNDSDEHRALNRRVEILVLPN